MALLLDVIYDDPVLIHGLIYSHLSWLQFTCNESISWLVAHNHVMSMFAKHHCMCDQAELS